MLVVVGALLAIASPLIAGRWPAGLIERRWQWPWLIWATLLFQVLVLELSMPDGLAATLHVLTYVAALGFMWFNRSIAGVWVVAAGAALNGFVIAINGGTLPARRGAVEAAGADTTAEFANSGVLENPRLPWLGDYFAWPEPLPLANTFSIGDVLIVLGAGLVAWAGSRRIGAPREEAKLT